MGRKKMVSRSSITPYQVEDFRDQCILDYAPENINVFDDGCIRRMEERKVFPDGVEFRSFDENLKADHVSATWVCFPEYPFTLGLTYPFPKIITDFFKITRLAYSQVMPMVWRVLFTLDRLNREHELGIGIPELAQHYQLRTHGSSRFVLQRRSGWDALVSHVTINESEWRNKFFFVKRKSIPDGDLLPRAWVLKAPKFETLLTPRSDTDKRLEALLELKESVRSFGAETIIGESSFTSVPSPPEMSTGISKSFNLSDLSNLMSVKKEAQGEPSDKVKFIPVRGKDPKKRKIEGSSFEAKDTSEILKEIGLRIAEVSKQVSEERAIQQTRLDESEKLRDIAVTKAAKFEKMHNELANKLKDLEAIHKKELEEVMTGAMKSAATAILQAKISMANDVEREGLPIFARDKEEWTLALVDLTGGDTVIPSEADPTVGPVAEYDEAEGTEDLGVKEADVVKGDEGGSTNA